MPTNEERREVAARLRNLDEGMWGSYSEEYEDLRWACLCDRGEYGGMELHERLADLIEPEPERTCHVVARYEARSRSEIGRERIELSCGHIVERHSKFCHNCGAKVVGE